MRLTDLCLVFVMIFICFVLPVDLRIKDDREKFYSSKEFNRSLDRTVTDALEDVVVEEGENGSVTVDEEKLKENFDKLLAYAFDLDDKVSSQKIYDEVYKGFINNGGRLTYEESDRVRAVMENEINSYIEEERIKNYRRDASFFRLTFPYSDGESWYQNIAGPMFFATFDPADDNMPWIGYDRVIFSGSRIEKR